VPTRVKICGITNRVDAELAIELGASALGFNFYRDSPRYITPDTARQTIRRAVPPLVTAVGVFADEAGAENVMAVARQAGVNAIQLHGPQFPSLDDGLRWAYPVIRAVAVDHNFEPESLRNLAQDSGAIMLDAYHPVLKGGTGRTIDWSKAREATEYCRVILAGGLTPENVGEAIRQVRPFAVDVATGVEAAPGVKDPSKLRAFFAAVRKADET
jgi:phosphoribosylanthranilate isomerase